MRKDLFWYYLTQLYNDVPTEMYEGLLSVLCIGATIILVVRGFREGWRMVGKLSLAEYVLLLLCATVLCRPALEEQNYNLRPFWSYFAMQEGRQDIASESIMNVVVFIPVGFFLGMAFKTMTWWKVLLLGLCVSISIELMQFLFVRGFAEVDDVIHNTVGCMIGFGLYKFIEFCVKKSSRKTIV